MKTLLIHTLAHSSCVSYHLSRLHCHACILCFHVQDYDDDFDDYEDDNDFDVDDQEVVKQRMKMLNNMEGERQHCTVR